MKRQGGTTQDPRLLGEKLDDALRRLDRNSEQIGDPNQGPSIAVRLTQLTSDLDQLQGQLNILDGIIKKTQGETHHTLELIGNEVPANWIKEAKENTDAILALLNS